jgi:Kef-type K+ transport system membrane component KefB
VSLSNLFLVAIVFLMPVAGFILTIGHARKAVTRREQRWRKSHGLLFWVLLPGLAGMLTLLGMFHILPQSFALIGIVLLAGSTFLSWSLQNKRSDTEV